LKYYFVNICANSHRQLGDLQNLYNLDIFHHTARQLKSGRFEVQGLLSEEQIEMLQAYRYYEVNIIGDAREVAKERSRELNRNTQ
jgi:hypothetical protein